MRGIMAAATLLVNQSINDNYGIKWTNEGMRKLALKYDSARRLCDEPLRAIVQGGAPYELPPDCLTVKRVETPGRVIVKDFRVDDRNRIVLPSSGTYIIEYLSMQPSVATLDDAPLINNLYWDALGIYVALKHLRHVGAESDYQAILLQDFDDSSADANLALTQKKRPRFIPIARAWR